MQSDGVTFSEIRSELDTRANSIVQKHLENRVYNDGDVQTWTNAISKDVVEELQGYNKNFKYTVMCLILQKSDAGLHISNSCFWNARTDGNSTIKWENDSMYCIVNIFALAL